MPNNNFTMSNATYDSASPKFGTGALSGGYGTVSSSFLNNTAAATTFDVWLKLAAAPTTAAFSGLSVAWCNAKSSATPTNLIFFGVNSDGRAAITTTGGTYIKCPLVVCDGIWHHARTVLTPTTLSLSVDGVLAGTSNATTTYDSSQPFCVGAFGDGEFPFGGEIDELAVFNIALPTAYTPPAAAYTGTETGLIALYHFDGDGNDSSGAGTASAMGSPLRVTWIDRSGVTAANTVQTIMNANPNRNGLWILNSPDSQCEILVNFTNAAGANIQSFPLEPGGSYQDPAGLVTTEAISVYCTQSNQQYYAKEC